MKPLFVCASAVLTKGGTEIIGKPADFGPKKTEEYIANLYYQPSDEVDPAWDLSGAVEDLRLLFEVGYEVGNGEKWPEWRPGAEFKPARDAMLRRK